jgi:hypothetical protein
MKTKGGRGNQRRDRRPKEGKEGKKRKGREKEEEKKRKRKKKGRKLEKGDEKKIKKIKKIKIKVRDHFAHSMIRPLIVDGGMGGELERRGLLRQHDSLWSARLLIARGFIRVH